MSWWRMLLSRPRRSCAMSGHGCADRALTLSCVLLIRPRFDPGCSERRRVSECPTGRGEESESRRGRCRSNRRSTPVAKSTSVVIDLTNSIVRRAVSAPSNAVEMTRSHRPLQSHSRVPTSSPPSPFADGVSFVLMRGPASTRIARVWELTAPLTSSARLRGMPGVVVACVPD